jgi:hypothetical protein
MTATVGIDEGAAYRLERPAHTGGLGHWTFALHGVCVTERWSLDLFPSRIAQPASRIMVVIYHGTIMPQEKSKSVTYGRFDAIFILTLFSTHFSTKTKNSIFTKRPPSLIETNIF